MTLQCGDLVCLPAAGGQPCTGIVKTCCYSFGSYDAALAFRVSQLAIIAAGVVTCANGQIHNTSTTTSVSQPQVHYGKSMNQDMPYGGWIVSKEYDLCHNQSSSYGHGLGGSLGNTCTCVAAMLGGGPIPCP